MTSRHLIASQRSIFFTNKQTTMCALGNWQTERPTIRDRTKFMLNNDLFSDVKFVAHKFDRQKLGR